MKFCKLACFFDCTRVKHRHMQGGMFCWLMTDACLSFTRVSCMTMCVRVCVCVYVRVFMCVCLCAGVCTCVQVKSCQMLFLMGTVALYCSTVQGLPELVLYLCVMGWLRIVHSLKLHISFAEYSLLYRALLQKRPILLRRLLIVASPYW